MALKALSQSRDVHFEQGTFDVRNWEVRLRPTDEPVGIVDDILVDEDGQSCYLDVDLSDGKRHVLLPCGETESDRQKNVVWLSGVGKERLATLPQYEHDPSAIDEEYERRISSGYDEAYTDEGFYERSDYRTSWREHEGDLRTEDLAPVDRLEDIEVASGSPDPRGWEVTGGDGKTLGKIEHLIGNTTTMRVRYLTMRVDGKIDEKKREILIPAGHVDLDTSRRRVRVNALDPQRVLAVPRYEDGNISREDERKLMKTYGDGYGRKRRYEHPRYRDDRLYRGAEERIPRREEEAVVSNEPQVKEEIVVKRRPRQETAHLASDVEQERAGVRRREAPGRRKS